MPQTQEPVPPRWLKPMNKVLLGLQRSGLAMKELHVLTVVGRKSGKPRNTPVSVFEVDDGRYVVGGFPNADWIRNVRAAGEGTLTYDRKKERVRLVELSADEARPILHVFPAEVPSGVDMMKQAGLVEEGTPAEFEALAGRCPVFRFESLN
ncbi:nitroreductase family deazaflavin-dependent oxidoreductase [Amycolatopsis nigrescens]|uniref:nitroreductase family deazaflavin-dependent oxidoreductase n=1 Tax=Amycolatopsis nigrescens TaxID=381445 RepID=UPI0003722541|nr:nitroreductase family deazaflavin-dependent oxidoreductase [Amycolatopsis nigrescens]